MDGRHIVKDQRLDIFATVDAFHSDEIAVRFQLSIGYIAVKDVLPFQLMPGGKIGEISVGLPDMGVSLHQHIGGLYFSPV